LKWKRRRNGRQMDLKGTLLREERIVVRGKKKKLLLWYEF